jgi:ubiquitin C-terminal hydrolase
MMVPCGLENLGNTCYLNATLQCIGGIPELRDNLIKYHENSHMYSYSHDTDCVYTGDRCYVQDKVAAVNHPDPMKKFVASIGSTYESMQINSSITPFSLVHVCIDESKNRVTFIA